MGLEFKSYRSTGIVPALPSWNLSSNVYLGTGAMDFNGADIEENNGSGAVFAKADHIER